MSYVYHPLNIITIELLLHEYLIHREEQKDRYLSEYKQRVLQSYLPQNSWDKLLSWWKEICSTIKKYQNIMNMIAALIKIHLVYLG